MFREAFQEIVESVVPCNRSNLKFNSPGKIEIGLASSKLWAVGKTYFKKREAVK